MTFSKYEKLSTAQDATKAAQEAEKAKNVKAAAGGESVKETLVEGVVHMDSSEIDTDIDVTQMAPTTYVSGKFKIKGPSRKKKGSDEEDVPYVPTAAEPEKVKRGRGIKRSAKPSCATPRKQKIRKIVVKPVKDKANDYSKAPVKVSVEVPIVEAQVHVPTPPISLVQQSVPLQAEFHSTPPQQTKIVEEPGNSTKKATTPIPQSSSQLEMPSNLGPGPTSLEDVGFFGDERHGGLIKRLTMMEKAKAETEEKLKQVEAENIVLKNELITMQDQIEDVKAGNNALNEAIDELLVNNYDLNEANMTISNANAILQKEIKDLKVKDENKSKQIEMLYAVIEDRLGINVHAAFDDIEIRRAEARRMEKEQKDAEEATEALKDKVKGVIVDNEGILGSSSQQEQQQPDVEVNVENVKLMLQRLQMLKLM
ncbi:hypothetical protein Hdeb2414_s0011g00370791 [Helianthus debilis subsp. tardiflorus]